MTNMKAKENTFACECCGIVFPTSHMSIDWCLSEICGWCSDRIDEEMPEQTGEIFQETF